VYPNDRVADFINQNFVPIKIHIKENKDAFGRFGAQWTPTLIVLDPEGKERYRFEGFLPPDDFLAQLETGLARSAFEHGQFQQAERRYRDVAQKYPKSEAAPEALYWAGVSKYKATNDPAPLGQAARELKTQYPESSWTKKASVWATSS
jgi:hypothetical protein